MASCEYLESAVARGSSDESAQHLVVCAGGPGEAGRPVQDPGDR